MAKQQRLHRGSRRQSEELAGCVEAVGHTPGGVRVAVDGHDRPVLWAVGEGLAVRTRPSLYRSALLGHRLVSGGVADEDRDSLVGAVEPQHTAPVGSVLGESGDVLRASPVVGAVAIAVGDDDSICHSDGVGVAVRREQVSRIPNELVASDETGSGRVDKAIATSCDH